MRYTAQRIKQQKELFLNFLLKNHAYSSFLINLHKSNHNFCKISSFLKEGEDLNNILCHSFIWDETNEGREFWFILNKMWNLEYAIAFNESKNWVEPYTTYTY